MSAEEGEDPFLQVQGEVLSALNQTRPLLASYLRIRSTPSLPPSNPELQSARRDLEQALSSLADDLADLVESVNAVEGDPARFGLSAAEVARRRQLVRDVGSEVERMRAQASTVAAGTDALPDPRAFEDNAGGKLHGRGAEGEGEEEEDDSYEAFEMQRQQELLHEQDEQLDGVFRTVETLRYQANEMGRELEEQGELLDEVDGLADRMGGKLQNGLKRVAWVVRNNEDSMSSYCIGILIFVLIVLLVIVLVAY